MFDNEPVQHCGLIMYFTTRWLSDSLRGTSQSHIVTIAALLFTHMSVTSALSNEPRWHLQRIVQREMLTDQQLNSGVQAYNLSTISVYPVPVTIYVIDSGVRIQHEEFADGRATYGVNFVDPGEPPTDCNGHGTHVAALAAGTYSGVATKARIISVRVLDCEGIGSCADIVSALDWVAFHFNTTRGDDGNARAIVVMSIGSSSSACDPTEQASTYLWKMGIIVAAAAGNQRSQSCDVYPVRNNHTIGVGATDKNDVMFEKNNFGDCVDIFAPGVSVLSAWGVGPNTALKRSTGTSMATPLVAGVAAIIVGADPTLTSTDVKRILQLSSTSDIVLALDGSSIMTESPNRFLYAPWSRIFNSTSMNQDGDRTNLSAGQVRDDSMVGNADWNSTATYGALGMTLWPRTKPAMAYSVTRIKEAISESMGINDDSILGRRAAGVTILANGSEPDEVDLIFYIPMAAELAPEYRLRLIDADKDGTFVSLTRERVSFANGSAEYSFRLNVTVPQGFSELTDSANTEKGIELMTIIIAVAAAMAILTAITLVGIFRQKLFSTHENGGRRREDNWRRNRQPVEDSDSF